MSATMWSVIMPLVIMLRGIMSIVVMRSVILPSVIMLSELC
jgi:hypothetical protein